jgi:purine-binding chemotaxis protein CheW
MDQPSGLSHNEYVTAFVAGQLFGLPILRVQDVFAPERLTRVPLAPPEVAGLINLRGRIVTLIDMRCRLGLAGEALDTAPMAIGVESHGESTGLLVDTVGEVHKLNDQARETNPINLDPRLASVCIGVHRLDRQLLLVADVDRILAINDRAVAA